MDYTLRQSITQFYLLLIPVCLVETTEKTIPMKLESSCECSTDSYFFTAYRSWQNNHEAALFERDTWSAFDRLYSELEIHVILMIRSLEQSRIRHIYWNLCLKTIQRILILDNWTLPYWASDLSVQRKYTGQRAFVSSQASSNTFTTSAERTALKKSKIKKVKMWCA